VLLLDCGDLFHPKNDNAEFLIDTLALMQYDAFSIAAPDLQPGYEFLSAAGAGTTVPFIASNLIYDGDRPSWASEYIIKEVGGIKVAVLGIISPEELDRFLPAHKAGKLRAIAPEKALKKLVPAVRKKADLVVLLNQLNTIAQIDLFQKIKGIDVSISSGCWEAINNSKDLPIQTDPTEKPTNCSSPDTEAGQTRQSGKTFLVFTGNQGQSLGRLDFALNADKTPYVRQTRHISLNKTITEDPEMAERVKAFKEELKIKEEAEKKKLLEGLELSPQEFMERYQKK